MTSYSSKIVGIQGLPGSYSEAAARQLYASALVKHYQTFTELFSALRHGDIAAAVCPTYNKVMGKIPEPTAILTKTERTYTLGQTIKLPVRHCLLGQADADASQLKYIHSQLPALDQCRVYLRQTLPNAEILEEADTALSAQKVANLHDPAHAAIASLSAGKLYGLHVLAADIQDDPANYTTFTVITLAKRPAARTVELT